MGQEQKKLGETARLPCPCRHRTGRSGHLCDRCHPRGTLRGHATGGKVTGPSIPSWATPKLLSACSAPHGAPSPLQLPSPHTGTVPHCGLRRLHRTPAFCPTSPHPTRGLCSTPASVTFTPHACPSSVQPQAPGPPCRPQAVSPAVPRVPPATSPLSPRGSQTGRRLTPLAPPPPLIGRFRPALRPGPQLPACRALARPPTTNP